MAKKAAAAKAKKAKTKKAKTKKAKTKTAKAKTGKANKSMPEDARQADRAGAPATAMKPPPGGALVRMYRIGHGDCFLIAFDGKNPDKPSFVLIDCGYKPGSPRMIEHPPVERPTRVKEICEHIMATTGGFVDVAIVTHEHQDHVNGLTSANFPDLKVGKVWFAWTENPKDDIANQLRKKFHDRLLGMIDTRANLMGLGKDDAVGKLDFMLEFELGDNPEDYNGANHLAAAAKDPAKSANKVAMKFLRDCAQGDPEYVYPHQKVLAVPGAKSARAFALGPPRDIDKIDDLDPVGDETFGDDHALGAAAGAGAVSPTKASPFSRRHVIPYDQAFTDSKFGTFFTVYYGADDAAVDMTPDSTQVPLNAGWRRMTTDDTADAGALALAMNNATNNASLVLAFELSRSGKVLLFAGDAQAGNWRSWSEADFDDEGAKITAKDLLARTVLYKVGHHGSHNATMKGKADSDKASLAAMAQGAHAGEFVAMITAVEAWAHQKPKPDWNHPFPAIKQALVNKAGGRVLQTDSSLPDKPASNGASGWQAFLGRVREEPLYFELRVEA